MRRLARGYLIHLRSRTALIRRNDDFDIGTHGKAYLFGPSGTHIGAEKFNLSVHTLVSTLQHAIRGAVPVSPQTESV
jgi:hypothetical protein